MHNKPNHRLTHIPKGELGTIDKILEEVLELKDAEAQNNKIMCIVELADIYGAIEFYLQHNFPILTMSDLEKMSSATKRAFQNGKM